MRFSMPQNEAVFEEALQQVDEYYVPADVHAEEAREKRGKRDKKVCSLWSSCTFNHSNSARRSSICC